MGCLGASLHCINDGVATDPCMGSGHILVYMFDILMDIYRSEGFSERDTVFSILENNIIGLDIDKRAYQLSYFALMMKARGYNRTFFRGKQEESNLAIEESNTVNLGQLKYFGASFNQIQNKLNSLFAGMERKIVFWYDDDAAYAEDIPNLELAEGNKICQLNDHNWFETKLLLQDKDVV